MIHLASSKMQDFLANIGKSDFTAHSEQFGQYAAATTDSAGVEDLRWDEYGNPYIADSTVH